MSVQTIAPHVDMLVTGSATDVAEMRSLDLGNNRQVRELATMLSNLVNERRAVRGKPSLFQRGVYAPPDHVYSEMVTARIAVANDDALASCAEITEAMAFNEIVFECPNSDEANVWNQWADRVNLSRLVRNWWRDEFTMSQAVISFPEWQDWEFTVEGRTAKGVKRKKQYAFMAPSYFVVQDSSKVVPIPIAGPAREMLCWHATQFEMRFWDTDPQLSNLMLGPWQPQTEPERYRLAQLGVVPGQLLLFDPRRTFRHTLTRPDYERFAPVRLKSVFRMLDLKQQLMDSDRAMLVGSANYILLVKKGDKDKPGTPLEIQNLQENFNIIAKVPVIIADHRLSIEIVSPKIDLTLQHDKYQTIDARLILRALATFNLMGSSQRNENSLTQGRLIAKGMELRRNEIADTVIEKIVRPIMERNTSVFDEVPRLSFVPKQITVDIDAVIAQAVQNARNTGDLSRWSYLEHFGFSEMIEAERKRIEQDLGLDDLFGTAVPYDSPDNTDSKSGRATPGNQAAITGTDRGGRPPGPQQGDGRPAGPELKGPNGPGISDF